jgi:UDP-N-acetylglucosamine acyltransferase
VARVHPTAVVDPAAKLADDAEVGPYAVVGDGVELGARVAVGAHAVIAGRTRVGPRTRIHPFCAIGGAPQILGEPAGTGLSIGADNLIREYVSIHAGSLAEGTRIGDGNTLLHGAHVAHDCRVGSHCLLGGQTVLAGHVVLEDCVALGGQVAVQPHCRIGELAWVASTTKLRLDVPPFAKVAGLRPAFAGVNAVGLRRRGFSEATIAALRHAFHVLFRSRLRRGPALERARSEAGGCPEVERLCRFVEAAARGVTR